MPSFGLEETMRYGAHAFQGDASGVDTIPPETADEFAQLVIEAICHASVTPDIGRRTFERCMRALAVGSTARVGFRHPAKAEAIDTIWSEREHLFGDYNASPDKLRFLATLPWVGTVTKHSLARRLGIYAEHGQRAVA
ncbi:hypothetical protein [Microvirga lotononidis]|uniref:Uncharacterized protein n=1 Tax=Microvirga lotononidis TaxID=864069 RepID=I4YXR3_9HYPH|nr:hypothetical protein [Microvirga lotononidis]EIM28755.1 hypothetical protein MicloDRAFT_00023990 [Microvirga lotononidis]WQO25510.1 hypothetical protein U0023_12330 [Microvirga lotononidis]